MEHNDQGSFTKHSKTFLFGFLLVGGLFFLVYCFMTQKTDSSESDYVKVPEADPDRIENGIHLRTGLIDAKGLTEVVTNCTSCHSAQLVTQNQMNKEGWIATIRWMQETQNLWDLGANEAIIVNYLVTNYSPEKKGRRQRLKGVEWYVLEE